MTESEAIPVVAGMVAKKCGLKQPQVRPDSRLLHDLNIDGDDAAELIQEICTHFSINMGGFVFDEFFGSEGRFFNPFWFLRRNSSRHLKNKRPLTVGQIAAAAVAGKWSGTE